MLEEDSLNLPAPEPLPCRSVWTPYVFISRSVSTPYVFIDRSVPTPDVFIGRSVPTPNLFFGDEAFTLQPNFMKPFPRKIMDLCTRI